MNNDCIRELGFGGRSFQVDAYNNFKNKKNTINVSPTGSGKSLVQVCCAAREIIESDYKQKQVFIVPQLDIGNGFSDHKHEYLKIDGKIYEWETTNNFCSNSTDSVKKIKKFLTSDIDCSELKKKNIIGGVTAIVSSSALVSAFKSMTKKEKKKMLENVTYRKDEGHHIMGVDDDFVPNRMGELTKYILDNDGNYHITTATLFRGDNQPIIGREYLKKFYIYRVPFIDHWNTLGLDKLNYDFKSYKSADDLFKQIVSNVKKNPQQRPMIILPSDKQKYFKYENKWNWTKKLMSELEKIFGKGKVLDLISDDTQETDKRRLAQTEQDFYAIVTCSIGREGTDWPACDYVHNTTLDNNLVQVIQKLGRVLRYYPGKKQVYFTNYIEHFPKWDSDINNIRERLSDRFNAIWASNMINDLLNPVVMPKLPKKESNKKIDNDNNNYDDEPTASLDDVFGPVKNNVVEEIMNEVWKIKQDDISPEKVEKIIKETINNHSDDILVDVDPQALQDRLMLEVARIQDPKEEKLQIKGCIVDFIREGGWDKIIRKSVVKGGAFSGGVEAIDLVELQKFLQSNRVDITIEKLEYCKNNKMYINEAAKYLGCCNDSLDMHSKNITGKTYLQYAGTVKFTIPSKKDLEYCINNKLTMVQAKKHLNSNNTTINTYCIKYFGKDYKQCSGYFSRPGDFITKEILIEWKNKGYTIKEISKKYNIHISTIDKKCIEYFKKTYTKWSGNGLQFGKVTKAKLIECKKKKLSLKQAAEYIGTTGTTIINNCNKIFNKPYGQFSGTSHMI